MSTTTASRPALYQIDDETFDEIRDLIYREAGVSLSDGKRALVCCRLAKRLRTLKLDSHSDYVNYLRFDDPSGVERQVMVNCLTTNKTDFFREPHHFAYLRDVVFPEIRERVKHGGPRRLRIWSSACSEGDEPCTIAMTVLEHLNPGQGLAGWDVKILATDINTEVLEKGRSGVYPLSRIGVIPTEQRRKYFLRGTGSLAGKCQVRPEVRRLIEYRQLNLLNDWPFRTPFDVIFCRNVLIYFDDETQRSLVPRFGEHLRPGGYLFLGHSENLSWLAGSFEQCGTTSWRLRGTRRQFQPQASPLPVPQRSKTSGASARGQAVDSASQPKELRRHPIIAGEAYATGDACEITTTLGSCVAACLWDPETGIGGMNHFMLPTQRDISKASARYGVHAMEMLITAIMKRGGDRRRLQAKLFGGADVLNFKSNNPSIGQSNIDFVREFLQTDGIPVVAEKLGGTSPLRVHFRPQTGKAFVKAIRHKSDLTRADRSILDSESREARKVPATGDVTFF